MYRQSILARQALRATRARTFATGADVSANEFAANRKAVRQHAVGEFGTVAQGRVLCCAQTGWYEQQLTAIAETTDLWRKISCVLR